MKMALLTKKTVRKGIASNSRVVLFSRDPPKVAHAPKTATHKKHPTNILLKEKHVHGVVLALPKSDIAFKTTKWLPNAKY